MAGQRTVSAKQMVTFGYLWLVFCVIVGLIIGFSVDVRAASPQYFTKAPWTFTADSGHWLNATVNGVAFGRVATGTYYSYSTSYLVPDEIFKNAFSQ